MAPRNPAPMVHPLDAVLREVKPFLDWVHRRLDAEIPPMVTATRQWFPPLMAAGASTDADVEVPGAAMGDPVLASFSVRLGINALLTASVTKPGVVTAVITHTGAAGYSPPGGTLRVVVLRYSV